MLINETGFEVLLDFLVQHHRAPAAQNLHAWAREAEESQGVVEIRAPDSLSGHTVALTLWIGCFDDGARE